MPFSFSLEIILVSSIAGLMVIVLFTLYLQDKLTGKVEYLEHATQMPIERSVPIEATEIPPQQVTISSLPQAVDKPDVESTQTETGLSSAVSTAVNEETVSEENAPSSQIKDEIDDKEEEEVRIQLLINELAESRTRMDEMSTELDEARKKIDYLQNNISENNERFELVQKQLGRLPKRLDDLEDTLTLIVKESLRTAN